MRYALRASRSARKALAETLPARLAAAAWEFINGPLLDDPRRVGTPLCFQFEGYYAARRGQYRVIYRVLENEVVVEVVQIAHRGDAHG